MQQKVISFYKRLEQNASFILNQTKALATFFYIFINSISTRNDKSIKIKQVKEKKMGSSLLEKNSNFKCPKGAQHTLSTSYLFSRQIHMTLVTYIKA